METIDALRTQNVLLREQNTLLREQSEERRRRLERVEEKLVQLLEMVNRQGQEIERLKTAIGIEDESEGN